MMRFHTQQRGIYPGSGWENEQGEGVAKGLVMVLKGGYNLDATAASAAASIRVLLSRAS